MTQHARTGSPFRAEKKRDLSGRPSRHPARRKFKLGRPLAVRMLARSPDGTKADSHLMPMKTIIIIGAGFSGAITAVNLARLSTVPLHLIVIDKSDILCRGIAYHTRSGSHLLNVAARNMSALADQPNHFVEWLQTRSEYLDVPPAELREKFIPRRVYGDYIQGLFQAYSSILSAQKGMSFEVHREEATALALDGDGASVTLRSGAVLHADHIVLAVGNKPPTDFPLRGLDPHSKRYIANPWIGWEKHLPAIEDDVLLVGTGLTMVDTVLSLLDMDWQGKIRAVSRNGLLPLPHFRGFDYPDFLDGHDMNISLREMFTLFKTHYRALKAQGLNPAILVDKLRARTQQIWQGFSLAEKKRFNRHLRTRWNVNRHRIAPDVHDRLQRAIADGRLEIIKGRLKFAVEVPETLFVTVESQGCQRAIGAGTVINCTGPRESLLPPENPLFAALLANGMVQPDELNLGIRVASNYAVIDANGVPSTVLFAIGSILRGTLWESVAVPELRLQSFRVSEHIVMHESISEILDDTIEYQI